MRYPSFFWRENLRRNFAPFPLDSGLFIGLINQICTPRNELSIIGILFLDVVLPSTLMKK